MKKTITLVSSIILVIMMAAPLFADLSGSDDFAFEDLTKWIKVESFDGSVGGQIQNLSGQAVYSVIDSGTEDDVAVYAWQLNSAPKSTSWEAMVDVFMPTFSLGLDEGIGLTLAVVWPNPLPSLEPVNSADVSLFQSESSRGFNVFKKTGLFETDLASVPTATTAGSLRVV